MNERTVRERLDTKTQRDELTGCLMWTGTTTPDGYGKMSVDGRTQYVHRLALELSGSTIPSGAVVDHKCRNRACVTVEHLHVVTQKQNLENQSSRGNSSSGHRGVSWCAQTRSWKVRVNHDGQAYWGGRHSSLESAVSAAIRLRGAHFTNNLDDHP